MKRVTVNILSLLEKEPIYSFNFSLPEEWARQVADDLWRSLPPLLEAAYAFYTRVEVVVGE